MIPTHYIPAKEDQPPRAPHGQQVHTTATPSPIETQRRLENLITGRKETPLVRGEQTKGAVRKGDHMPYGKARSDVRDAIRQQRPTRPFTHKDVWSWFDEDTRIAWAYFYGGNVKAISRVATTLNGIYKKVPMSEFPLVKVPHRSATYEYMPNVLPEVATPKPESKPKPKEVSAMDAMQPGDTDPEYVLIGYDLHEQPLYQNDEGVVGYLTFTKLGL